MMYHFPTRDALVHAIHEHLAAQWTTSLESTAGKATGEATAKERAIAYVDASDQAALGLFIARLAADGLWMYESLTGKKLAAGTRKLIADQIVNVIKSAED